MPAAGRLVPFALLCGLLALFVLRSADATAPGPVGQIVYVAAATAPGSIAVVSADGTNQHTSADVGSSPTWSPAGDQIAYVDAGGIEVMTYDQSSGAFGSPAAVPGTAGATSVDWSPDGSTFAYSDGANVWTVPVGGGTKTQLTFSSGGTTNTDPRWSPEGTKLAFVSNRDGNDEIYVMNADGSSQQDLSSSGHDDREPDWAPNGDTILYASDRNNPGVSYQIYSVPSAGGASTQLTNEAADDEWPTWSPDGSEFALTQSSKLATLPPGGGNPSAVGSGITASQPEWGLQFGVKTPPSISAGGTLGSGTVLTASPGTWSGPTQPPAFGYQWKRCNSAGAGCVSIGGANGSTYTLTTADGGSTIRVTVTATETGGSASATSAQTGIVATASPVNTTLPKVIFGGAAPLQGTAVSANVGVWSGTTPFSYAYQWERCNETGGACVLTGATTVSYTPTVDDIGHTLRVIVTATNGAGSASAESAATPKVAGLAPAPVTYPSTTAVTPTLVGRTLIGSIGTWSGQAPITFTFNWQKCDANFNCTDILGANSTTFVIPLDLIGWRIAFDVRATNSQGNGEARSALSSAVAGDPPYHPYNQPLPVISGRFNAQQQVTASTGFWTGFQPMSFSYQWRRCDPGGNNCSDIPGATVNTYTLTTADQDHTVRVVVTASNLGGTSVPLSSDHTAVVGPRIKVKPLVANAPSVLGTAVPGKLLRAADGTWTGTMPMTFRHHWRRCDATGAHCKTIPKARARAYVVTRKDVGYTIRAVVTARNVDGATSAITQPTDTVQLVRQPRGRRIVATRCSQYLAGGAGDDTIIAKCGNNTIVGGAGNDLLVGGPGNDVIIGGPGQDRILGGKGSDTIIADDGEKDVIDCGPGNDSAVVDSIDVVKNCEKVTVVAPPTVPPPIPGTTTTPLPTTTTTRPTTTATTSTTTKATTTIVTSTTTPTTTSTSTTTPG